LEPQRSTLGRVLVIDDRPRRDGEDELRVPPFATLLRGEGQGPAAARNLGWRASRAEWIAFLDDDVIPSPGWARSLVADLRDPSPAVAASQGRVSVPRSPGRPTDWERNVAGLETARWITADMVVRRSALEAIGGFDERFPRAYREDTDLALRLLRGGWQIARGARRVEHPVGEAGFWISIARQRGNADDVLMRALHGPHWRRWAGAPRGRLRTHLLSAAALLGTGAGLAAGRRRLATALGAGWLGLTARLAQERIAPGPREGREAARMVATSAALPAAATFWAAWGWLRLPALLSRAGPHGDGSPPPRSRPEAVLLDRDGTLLFDVPYNGDPAKVAPMPGARRALERLRGASLPLAVVSNQSGIGRGLIRTEQVGAVNRRAEELLGPIDSWLVCPHAPEQGCGCRKPEPGLVLEAAERLGVRPERCALIGDIAADVQAAQAAGATAVIVPTPRTEREDARMAPFVAASIEMAVEDLLGGERR
jgi:histidinol-phosphate phosphatase family protein